MLNFYHAWHTHYVCDIWRGEDREFPSAPSEQIEFPIAMEFPAPKHYQARMIEANAWAALNDTLEAAIADASSVSIHRHWLKDVQETLAGEFCTQALYNEADSLLGNLKKYNIYDGEREHCRAVAEHLQRYAKALKFLVCSEGNRYQQMTLHENFH